MYAKMQKLFVFLCFLIIIDYREKTAINGLTVVEKLIFSLGNPDHSFFKKYNNYYFHRRNELLHILD